MTRDLVGIGQLSAAVGLSVGWLRRLADEGAIPSHRSPGGHRRFDVAAVERALEARGRRVLSAAQEGPISLAPEGAPDWRGSFGLDGLEEHEVWRHVRDALDIDVTTNGGKIVQHAFNEMLNNAIDHSGGTAASVSVWARPDRLAFSLHDDGRGVFAHLKAARGLASEVEAVAELTKGKVTTMPDRHTGEGIFFTSKAVDLFQLASGRLRWTVDNLRQDQALGEVTDVRGTSVFAQVDPATPRVLASVFAEFTEDFDFVRSRPSVKLFGLGLAFVSRSEARRLLQDMDRFSEVEVDFTGVDDVGQAFVDELLRVWPSQHPEVHIVPVNMNAAVEFMVRRGLPNPPTRPSPATGKG